MNANTRSSQGNQEPNHSFNNNLLVFLTDLSFIRIQKRSYAEASRRVGYFHAWLTGWSGRTKLFLAFCRYICRVVMATWSDYAVAGYSENIFLYADDIAGAVSGSRVSLWS